MRKAVGFGLVVVGLVAHGVAWALAGGQAVGVWFYQAAWWTYLAAVAGFLLLRAAPSPLLDARLLSMLPWSVVWWVLFELMGLRLRNWYYVMLPPERPLRWVGFWTAFATVIPLTVATHDALKASGLFLHAPSRAFPLTPRLLRTLRATGLACFGLAVLWPRWFFPLTWLWAPLLIEPTRAERGHPCLLTELSEGRAGTFLRLLVTGLVIGGLWELFNSRALARWIYTVPGFSEGKVFEMPAPGFLGFPPFAVGTYSFWHALEGVWSRRARSPWRAGASSIALTLPLCVAAFAALDAGTVRSYLPRAGELPGWEPWMGSPSLRASTLLDANLPSVPSELTVRWRKLLVMAAHRGMGLERAKELEAMGIREVRDLADFSPRALLARWPSTHPPREEEVAIWIAAARKRGPP